LRKPALALLCLGAIAAAAGIAPAAANGAGRSANRGAAGAPRAARAETTPPTGAAAAAAAPRPYPGYTSYAQLGRVLKQIDRQSERVSVGVFGRSAGGRPLWLVTVQRPWASTAAKARCQRFLRLELQDPTAALAMLRQGGDLRVPVFVDCSIHGDEVTGVDAGLRLLRKLAFGHDASTERILRNDVILINACANPDGRVAGTRENAAGFDLNRDFVTQSQPETRAIVGLLVKWHPAVFEDLHGYYDPLMILDPSTAPHDPNYDWDLAIRDALPLAQAQKLLIRVRTHVRAEIAYTDQRQISAVLGYPFVFEDYEPFYAPQTAMFYGLVAQTLETSTPSTAGVDAHYYAVWEAASYAAAHRARLLRDQLARFLRAESGASQPASADVPAPLTFPFAYVIPVDPALQKSPDEACKAVRLLLRDGIRVERATAAFSVPGQSAASAGAAAGTTGAGAGTPTSYPAGTYVVPLRQPLRGLANVLLWRGQDMSAATSDVYDSMAWQLPESWGFDRNAVNVPFGYAAAPATGAPDPGGSVSGASPDYVLPVASDQAVRAANFLLAHGLGVSRVTAAGSLPLGAFIVHAAQASRRAALVTAALRFSVSFASADPAGNALQPLHRPKVAVFYDGPTRFVLRDLGFDATVIHDFSRLAFYDVLVLDDANVDGLGAARQAAIRSWVAAGGVYIANGPYGYVPGLLGVTVNGEPQWSVDDPASYTNALALTDYRPGSLITAGLGPSGSTFAFPPAWFTDLGAGVSVDATYAIPFLEAGWWAATPAPAAAAGQAVIVHGAYGAGRVTYFGPMPAFRAGTDGTFRLLANAIFTGNAAGSK
jgi:hypothetical protein